MRISAEFVNISGDSCQYAGIYQDMLQADTKQQLMRR
jgi:hypothetical protein